MQGQTRITLFGGLSVQSGERVFTRFRTRRTAAALAYLAIHLGRAIPRSELADAIWPDSDSPRQSLRMALTSLRKQLGDIFIADSQSVAIREGVAFCDVKHLLQSLSDADHGDDLALCWQAIDGHKGRLLPGFFDVWILDLQDSIDRRTVELAMGVAAAEVARGSRKAAIRACTKVLEIDAGNEAAAKMLADLSQGSADAEPTRHQRSGSMPGLVAVLVSDGAPGADRAGRLQEFDVKATDGSSFVFARASDAAKAALTSGRCGIDCLEVDADGTIEKRLADALRSVASPGQCLVSERAAALLRNRKAFSVTDLGLYRLPGVRRPSRVFQLVPAGIRREFPPINAHPALSGPIPASFTRFIGREVEIADIVRHFEPHGGRLLSLVGPGGNGKTRLALEAVKILLDDFQGRVWFIPLADVSGNASVGSVTLETLGIKPSANAPGREIADLVGELPSLLVFDNAEHVVEGVASLVQEILVASPRTRCLVTSRARLGIQGERLYPVMPLPTPAPTHAGASASVLLFIDRAQAVIPDFALSPANAEAISQICLRLEGIPLAIELAAARIRLFPPTLMLEQLDERLSFLKSNARGVPERQQTMRLAIDWSYRLLSERLQILFRQLSVFRNGWTARAAAQICGATEEDLGSLVDSSLITVSGQEPPRFHILETLREYSSSQLSDDERIQVSARHRAFFHHFVELASTNFRTSRESEALLAIDEERENVGVALRDATTKHPEEAMATAVRLERFWEVRGHYGEAYELLQDLLSLNLEPRVRAEGETSLSLYAIHLGRLDEAQAMLEHAISTFQDLGDGRGLGTALRRLGNLRYWLGDYAEASNHYSRAEEYATDAREISALQHNLGNVRKELGDLTLARQYFESSIALSEQLGDTRNALASRFGLASVDEAAGALASAEAGYHSCLQEFDKLGDRFNAAQCLHFLGNLAAGRGDGELARDRFERSKAINIEIGDAASLASNLFRLSRVHLLRGDNDLAVEAAREGCTLLLRQGFRPELASALARLAVAYQASGLAQPARYAFDAYSFVRRRTETVLDEDEQRELRNCLGDEPKESIFPENCTPGEIARSLSLVL